jgi:hypothetical protein
MPRRRPRAYGNREDMSLSLAVRHAYGWSQAELGQALGVTQGAISHIEQQRRPFTPIMRESANRLVAMWGAQQFIERRMYHCNGQTLGDPVEFLQHMQQCSKCMAKAWALRHQSVSELVGPRTPPP